MDTTIETLLASVEAEANRIKAARIEQARHDYNRGMEDCRAGIYEKWYRYNHSDDGRAYDTGWMEQNRETKVENIKFVNY